MTGTATHYVMHRYNLEPNGGILTALNLFTTKFDEVLDLVEKRSEDVECVPALQKPKTRKVNVVHLVMLSSTHRGKLRSSLGLRPVLSSQMLWHHPYPRLLRISSTHQGLPLPPPSCRICCTLAGKLLSLDCPIWA